MINLEDSIECLIEKAEKRAMALERNVYGLSPNIFTKAKKIAVEIGNKTLVILNMAENEVRRELVWNQCIPQVLKGPEGSIDLRWCTELFNLLLNIPFRFEPPIRYYISTKKYHITDFSLDKTKEKRIAKKIMRDIREAIS